MQRLSCGLCWAALILDTSLQTTDDILEPNQRKSSTRPTKTPVFPQWSQFQETKSNAKLFDHQKPQVLCGSMKYIWKPETNENSKFVSCTFLLPRRFHCVSWRQDGTIKSGCQRKREQLSCVSYQITRSGNQVRHDRFVFPSSGSNTDRFVEERDTG